MGYFYNYNRANLKRLKLISELSIINNCRLIKLDSLLNDSPDELLYGKSGYLYALLFIKKYTDIEVIPSKQIEKV